MKPGRFGPSPLSLTVLWRRCKHARKLLAIRSRPPRSGSCGRCRRSVASRLRTVPQPPRCLPLGAAGRLEVHYLADGWHPIESHGLWVRPRRSIKAIKAYDWTYSSPFQGTLVLAERSPVRPPAPRWRNYYYRSLPVFAGRIHRLAPRATRGRQRCTLCRESRVPVQMWHG
jgi:hypothetical protein